MSGRHRAPRDWWPAVLAAGAAGLAAGCWLFAAGHGTGGAGAYSAGTCLAAAWIGHDITVRLPRRRR